MLPRKTTTFAEGLNVNWVSPKFARPLNIGEAAGQFSETGVKRVAVSFSPTTGSLVVVSTSPEGGVSGVGPFFWSAETRGSTNNPEKWCSACEEGGSCPGGLTTQSSSQECAMGTYVDKALCRECATGTYSNSRQSSICTQCPEAWSQQGWAQDRAKTYCCPPSNGGICTQCSNENACDAMVCNPNYFDINGDVADGCEVGCAAVTNGTCTACTTAAASGCTAVTCATNAFDTNGNATDGCEAGCAAVANGACTACITAVVSGCTALNCNPNYFDTNGEVTDGCEDGCVATNGICATCTSAVADGCTSMGSCDLGFADHDGSSSNGCEIDLEKLQLTNEKNILNNELQACLGNTSTLTNEKNILNNELQVCLGNTTLGNQLSLCYQREQQLVVDQNTLMAQRDALILERNALTTLTEHLQSQQVNMTLLNNGLESEKNLLKVERDAYKHERDNLTVAKATLEQQFVLLNASLVRLRSNADASSTNAVSSPSSSESETRASTTTVVTNSTKATNATCECNGKEEALVVDLSPSAVPLSSFHLVLSIAVVLFVAICIIVVYYSCCRGHSEEHTVVAPVQHSPTGKFGYFMEKHKVKIQEAVNHDHVVSVQNLSRTHSRAKVKKIQAQRVTASSRLQARIQARLRERKKKSEAVKQKKVKKAKKAKKSKKKKSKKDK